MRHLSDVLAADLPSCMDGLKAAAREVGAWQIQNAATVAGNLCNASPAADGVPPLLALNAAVTVQSATGSRTMPLQHFILGNRRTALAPGEMLTHIHVPAHDPRTRSVFLKLGARRYLVISIAMVSAVVLCARDGTIADLRVAVGACSAVRNACRSLSGTCLVRHATHRWRTISTRAMSRR